MKQLLILCLSLSLFIACKDKKDTRRDDTKTTTEKDDYRNTDTDDRGTKESDNKNNDDNKTSSWSSNEVYEFVSNCTSSAVKGGLQQQVAEKYCECMQQKMETLYPDAKDVAQVSDADLETPTWKKRIADCLTGN